MYSNLPSLYLLYPTHYQYTVTPLIVTLPPPKRTSQNNLRTSYTAARQAAIHYWRLKAPARHPEPARAALSVFASRALVSVDEAFVLRRSCGSGDQPVVFERAVEGFGGGSGGLWVLGFGWCWSGDGSLEIWWRWGWFVRGGFVGEVGTGRGGLKHVF